MTLRISVRGTAAQTFPAEYAAVPIQIAVEAPQRDEAHMKAAALRSELGAALDDFAAAGGVRTWSSDQVRAHTWRDQHKGRDVGKPRHEARVDARAEFVMVEALEKFADAWLPREGVTIGYLQWDLLPDNRRAREAEVRRGAVADAVAKAADYADALGFPAPSPVHIADAGMSDRVRPMMAMQSFAKDAAESEPAISLVPEEIRIEVVVEAEFAAE
jgi:uncharacterized protein